MAKKRGLILEKCQHFNISNCSVLNCDNCGILMGKAPAQLRYLRETFESIPYPLMEPRNELIGKGAFCLAKEGEVYLVYLADVRESVLHVKPGAQGYTVTWINPRTGKHTSPARASQSSIRTAEDKIILRTPSSRPSDRRDSSNDWAAIIEVDS